MENVELRGIRSSEFVVPRCVCLLTMANNARVYRTGKKKNTEQTVCPVALHRMLEGKTTLTKVTGNWITLDAPKRIETVLQCSFKPSRRLALATNFTAEQIRSHVLS